MSRSRARSRGGARSEARSRPRLFGYTYFYAQLMTDFLLFDEEFQLIKDLIARLKADSQAKVVFIVDKNGQQIAAQGDLESLDTTSLASLTAGNVAATDGLARLIGEREFPVLFHEGERDNVYIAIVAQRVILVVIFDERSSLGLVRLRVKRATQDLERIFEAIQKKVESEKDRTDIDSPFAEITDDDIDSLFRD